MKKKRETGFVLFVTIAVLVMVGCPQEVEIPSDDAGLSSIAINGVSVRVPEGINRDTWLGSEFSVSSMDVAEALLPSEAFNTSVVVDVGVKGDATVWYLKISGGLKPSVDDPNWTDTANFTFKERDSLYIQVTSADKTTQSYYWVRINKASADGGLFALTIADRNVGVLESMGANSFSQVDMKKITLTFGKETNNVPVKAITKDALATVQYGFLKATDTATEPQWGDTANFTFDDGDKVYAKVTPSGPNANPRYYGAVVNNTTYLRVSAVNIGGISQSVFANGSSIDITRIRQTVSGVLAVTAADGVSVEYDLLSAEGTPEYKPIPEDTSPAGTPLTYTDASVLYLKASVAGYNPVYYQFNIALKSNNRSITSISIGGGTATAGTGATTPSVGTYTRGAATISSMAAAAGSTVMVIFSDSTANITGFTVLASNVNPTAASYENTMATPAKSFTLTAAITSGQHLSIRVQAEDGTVYYHRIVVTVQ
jgi:hypothetical protein